MNAWSRTFALAIGLASAARGGSVSAASPPGHLTFNDHVQPILSEYCYRCHGPDSGSRKAGLRLDRAEFALAGREGGPAIVRGDAAGSPLIRRVKSTDAGEVMPPPETHQKLKPEEIAILEAWVNGGAAYQEHWSFIRPKRPPVPGVRGGDWARNPVDHFVLARLEAAGLEPNGPEEKRRLLRRVTLDLTGLPPGPEEAEAFAREGDPGAYEGAVDRLLASPRYGEHMARYWLDAARYADTHGIHIDNYRSIWPYRDWVIRAFNENMPFDRFTVEQLAGDLLPRPSREQRIATGFNRCNPTTNEGGAIDDEYYAIYAKDRVETTSATWMGLTMGCASCHDHKFDPISMREFYAFAAYFRNTTQKAMDGNIATTPPVIYIPKPEDEARWGAIDAEIAAAQAARDDRRGRAGPAMAAWAARAKGTAYVAKVDAKGLRVWLKADEGDGDSLRDAAPGQEGRVIRLSAAPQWLPGPGGMGAVLTNSASADIGDVGNFENDEPFAYGAWVQVPRGNGALLARMDEQDNNRGWDLFFADGRPAAHLISRWNTDAIKVQADKQIKPGTWAHVFVTYDGSKKAAGVKIYIDGVAQKTKAHVDQLTGSIKTGVPLSLGRRSQQQRFRDGAFRDLRLYGRLLSPTEVSRLAAAGRMRELLALEPAKRSAAQAEQLLNFYLENEDPAFGEIAARLRRLEGEKEAMRGRATPTLVMEEKAEEAFAHILARGQYDQPGEKVFPAVPAVLPPLPPDAPKNRLALARWLVAPEHPLTARVTVNRFWQQLFGVGLVATAEDFGITGQRPSHPKLLDWLAVEFRETGWDVKRMMRLLVTSASYRQSARVSPEKLEKDPDNRLVSRGPRHRMDGEMIRDLALDAGGLLVEKIGGPSVKPYQPDGIWETVAMPQSDTKEYERDSGEALYRRSLYTFWKRSAPPPSMEIFNAPTREQFCVRRERTNTPLQALVVMNDPQFVEASRALAALALRSGGDSPDARLDFIAARLLARPLAPEERDVLRGSIGRFAEAFDRDPEGARRLLAVGESKPPGDIPPPELATWTMAANLILNLDESLNK